MFICTILTLACIADATAGALYAGVPVYVAQSAGGVLMQQVQNAQPQAVQVKVADALDNVLRNAAVSDEPAAQVFVQAARGEYESAQLVVRSTQPIKRLRAVASALKGPGGADIPATELRCRFVGYVGVEKNTDATPLEELVTRAPGDFPDPLLEDEAIDVPANTAQPIWVTLHVPLEAQPGQYEGLVNLAWEGGERSVPIKLTVWPFAIPQERHLYFTNWVSASHIAKRYGVEAYSEDFWRIFEKFVANAAAHRQNIMWVSPYLIRVFREPDGKLSFDFSRFDRWIKTCEKHGVADLIEISQLGGFKEGWGGKEIELHGWSVTDRASGKAESRPAEEVLPALLPALQEHLRERGWLRKTVLHIADEPSINNVKSWRQKSDWVHSFAPEIRRIDAIEAPDFGDSLEVWVPKLSHFYNWQAAYEEARQRGAELWFYTCCHPMGRYPNRFVDYPLIKTRVLHWINWRYRLKGYLHWGLLFWTDDPFKSAISGGLPPGDAWIVYPGPDGPMDSIRWETLRDGIEDYEYLWLLTATAEQVKSELGKAAEGFDATRLADDLCAEVVPGILDYVREPAKLRDVRQRIADEITGLTAPPRLLVWTEPPASHALAAAPAVAVLHVAAEKGTKVTVNGRDVELDETGFYGTPLFLQPGVTEITVTASRDGATKTVRRGLKVIE